MLSQIEASACNADATNAIALLFRITPVGDKTRERLVITMQNIIRLSDCTASFSAQVLGTVFN